MRLTSIKVWARQLAWLSEAVFIASCILVPLFFFVPFPIVVLTAYYLGGAYAIGAVFCLLHDLAQPPQKAAYRKRQPRRINQRENLDESSSINNSTSSLDAEVPPSVDNSFIVAPETKEQPSVNNSFILSRHSMVNSSIDLLEGVESRSGSEDGLEAARENSMQR